MPCDISSKKRASVIIRTKRREALKGPTKEEPKEVSQGQNRGPTKKLYKHVHKLVPTHMKRESMNQSNLTMGS
jgi:hypothetical protein